MAPSLPFTAVVVTWNSADEVEGLIDSVRRHLGACCRLLFVDNGSTDGTLDAIGRAAPDAEVIALAANVGFGPANNIGVRAAGTEVVVLLNPDTIVVDDSLATLAELAASERALFAPRLLNEDGTVQISAWPPLVGWESLVVAIWPGALLPASIRRRCEPWRYEERLPAGWLSGACLVARRDLLLHFGPFDERLVLYGEDGDLCVRAQREGVPCIAAADVARVVHLGGRSGSQAFSDVGRRRKIEARWWVVHHRLGPVRGYLDLAIQFLQYGVRWLTGRALGRDVELAATWLRVAPRVIRAGRPPVPRPLGSRVAHARPESL